MMTDDSLHGRVVLSGDGLAIGEVSRLLIDPSDWHVSALEVKLRDEVADRLGVHARVFRSATMTIPTAQVQSIGDAVILTPALDHLRPEAASPA